MKRIHIHLSVKNIEKSVAFYSKLFGQEPTMIKNDYAKWMLDDPRVNFAMSSHCGTERGVEHIGIQSENAEELADVYGRLKEAGQPVLDEGEVTCCYAQSEKNWTSDPDGVVWEAFLSSGEATHYGDRIDAEQVKTAKPPRKECCAP
ncbi:ArsI/CadI family heavy metal resistance metalloenzyme [Sphingorhabdus sp. Alg239-R122]|uniref:ArsI/CadI family heavy metal resistance metalloenzyme n=1 Tax=Sphingorhabdus sp. Alg239-R122 TaxID=2305989 RepID=UPI0013D904D0|nr:ArsI/CadI family heavy metal resistance metalloenzyme [Sphingorhabdus sp. Alg239-R122]